MRKIVSSLFISLDGVVEAPNKWTPPYWSDDVGAAIGGLWSSSDALLLGRQTYQEFYPAWSSRDMADDPGADFMNNTRKYVVSSTLDKADWNNSTVISVDDVAQLKQEPGSDISISGSGSLVRSLLTAGLVDELHLFLYPVVVGSGKRLFPDGTPETSLKLSDSTPSASGVLHLAYQPAR
jgi:dihydrofolate reductase